MSTSYEERIAETAERYGCDSCGKPKSAHLERGTSLYCDEPPRTWALWKNSHPWTDDGHRLSVEFRLGRFCPVLVCPDEGCPTLRCHCTGEEGWGEPSPGCRDCGGTGDAQPRECWLQHVLEHIDDFEELTRWSLSFNLSEPVPILWHGGWDDFAWRPRTAPNQMPPEGDEATKAEEARGSLDDRPGGRASNQEGEVERAAGALLTGQCRDGSSQVPAREQDPGAGHGGAGLFDRTAAGAYRG